MTLKNAISNKNVFAQYYDRFYRAYSNISFSPEKRAAGDIACFNEELAEDLQELEKAGGTGNYEEKYINRVLDIMDKKARCLSFMITGPARFPVARNEKNNRYADNAWAEFRSWRERYIQRAFATPTPTPEEDLDKALKELDKQSTRHERMKIANKVCRREISAEDKAQALQDEAGFSATGAAKVLTPNCFGGIGFETFELTNSNAKIKRLRNKVLAMKTRIARKADWEPIKFEGGLIDIQADRVIVHHDEKPEREIIDALKGCGFRWSRRFGNWSRKHTGRAIIDAKRVCGISA